jgi:hypothetical protein
MITTLAVMAAKITILLSLLAVVDLMGLKALRVD